ncbi:MAG TPA: T9SS type A sorting domain-containing protein, partial [Candidatus Marinimicrobia bacterium]|nr:T9SS type A sorting domain-containing protein [Candidatus Neomarinimicrobiota bacterium]
FDCIGVCDGSAELDECGECRGDGPDEGYNCDGTPLLLEEELLPNKYSLINIYPNPFNPVTTIKYGLPDYVPVKIAVYDILGRQVAVLINNYQSPGFHSVVWEASSYPSGLYFIRMVSNNFTDTRKILLIK